MQGRAGRGVVQQDGETGARRQFPEHAGQHVVAGQLGDQVVELAGEPDVGGLVAPFDRGGLRRQVLAQGIDIVAAGLLRERLHYRGFDDAASLEGVRGLVGTGVRDEGTAIVDDLHHLLVFEPGNDLADLRPAYAEDGGQLLLGKLGTRAKLVREH